MNKKMYLYADIKMHDDRIKAIDNEIKDLLRKKHIYVEKIKEIKRKIQND